MADVRELKDQAAKHFSKGKFDKAAATYEELVKLEPKDMQMRVRLGDALVKKGDKEKAVSAYKIAAETYAKEGFLPRAIAVCKLIMEIDPKHTETQAVLAQLYAKKTGRPVDAPPPKPFAGAPASSAATSAIRPATSSKPAPAPVKPKPAAGEEELELDTTAKSHGFGVKADAVSEKEIVPIHADSGLELDDAKGNKGARWQSPNLEIAGAVQKTAASELPAELELEIETEPAKPASKPVALQQKAPPTPVAAQQKAPPTPTPTPVAKPVAAPVVDEAFEIELDTGPATPPRSTEPEEISVESAEAIEDEGSEITVEGASEVEDGTEITIEGTSVAEEPPPLAELDFEEEKPVVAAPPVAQAVVAPPKPVPSPVVAQPPKPAPPPEPVLEIPAPPPAEDDLMFAETESAAPAEAKVATAMSLDDLNLDEPELLGMRPAPAASPGKRPIEADSWNVAKTPAQAPPRPAANVVQKPVPVAAPPAQAAGADEMASAFDGNNWFAPPEGLDMEPELPGSVAFAPPAEPEPTSLAQLDIASITEEEESIELVMTPEPKPDEEGAAAALPQIPLFSDLSHEAFIELASACDLRRLNPGDVIIQEGTIGGSFFVLCSGKVKVAKQGPEGEVILARLPEGSFFGEMALLSGAPRAASVIAEDEAECLEISAVMLAGLQKRYPQVGQVLKKFCRQRLLANVMATSPLFRPFDKAERKALVEKFKARELVAGEKIVEEGKIGDGLYVIMAGEVEVLKEKDGVIIPLATMKEGDVFGEISLLTKSAATATVVAKKRSTVLRLPRKTFDELISTHPQILILVSELSDERLKIQEALVAGSVSGDSEGLMII